jgi:hypothetical protein
MANLTIVPLSVPAMKAQIIQGQTDPVQGWISFFSGEKQAAPVLRYRYRGAVPVQFCTLLYPARAGEMIPLAIAPLTVAADDGRPCGDETLTGLEIRIGSRADYLVLDRRSNQASKMFTGYRRDGSVIYVRGCREGG